MFIVGSSDTPAIESPDDDCPQRTIDVYQHKEETLCRHLFGPVCHTETLVVVSLYGLGGLADLGIDEAMKDNDDGQHHDMDGGKDVCKQQGIVASHTRCRGRCDRG